ncbi:MAG TPA: VWA domain-containing protein [Thermoanaerobaculia bacterium]|nr:VWA domain-containing protein [Thermoanaerobaculia bacterium]
MRRVVSALGLSLVCAVAGSVSVPASTPPFASPRFEIVAPDRMVTGSILLHAEVQDPNVLAVKWVLGDFAKTTPRPFELTFDVGPVPAQRKIRALALDARRQPLYERVAVLNRGGRGLGIDLVTPVQGERASGPTEVRVRVHVPADDAVELVSIGGEARDVTLEPLEGTEGVFATVVEVPGAPAPLVARVKTRRGRTADASILLNARGISAAADAHVVEQMVHVSKNGVPIENLTPADFKVADERGICDIREVRLVRDTPLAVGFAVDTSISLRHNRELLRETATSFIDACFKEGDAGFVYAFGPVVSKVRDWTDARSMLTEVFGRLPETDAAGTNLYEAIVKALYQFQGSQGARALILATDGEDFEGDVSEDDALAYARQSGVPIYTLALTSQSLVVDTRTGTSSGKWIELPPNMNVLSRFAQATGGRAYLVKQGADLREVFKSIERDIRTQYLVSYVSNARSQNCFHPVEVTARHGVVHTAAGFFF